MERDRRGGYNRKRVKENFFKEWSPDMAYVLGFIYADGAVEDCRQSSRTCYLSLANNDFPLLEKIRKTMASNHNIQLRKAGLMIIRGKEYFRKNSYTLRIGNKMMYQDLLELGLCPRKSLIISLPKIPSNYFHFFLRGYFDGDGCLHIEKKTGRLRIIFTCGSGIFLNQILEKLGLRGNVLFNCGAYRLIYRGEIAEMVASVIYNNIDQAPYLKYKYNRYIDYLRSSK